MALTISGAVRAFSTALAKRIREDRPESPSISLLQAIGTMPNWVEKGRLDEWERLVQSHDDAWSLVDGEIEPFGSLIQDTFELGRFNLYKAMDPIGTRLEYARIQAKFSAEGITPIPDINDRDLAAW